MEKSKKLNCYASQCCYWEENCGCTKNEHAENGREPCGEYEELYSYKVYVIVERGLVIGVYADKPELSVEVLDLDNSGADGEATEERRIRAAEVAAKYHEVYAA